MQKLSASQCASHAGKMIGSDSGAQLPARQGCTAALSSNASYAYTNESLADRKQDCHATCSTQQSFCCVLLHSQDTGTHESAAKSALLRTGATNKHRLSCHLRPWHAKWCQGQSTQCRSRNQSHPKCMQALGTNNALANRASLCLSPLNAVAAAQVCV
jgi:hypothetical protein